MNFDAINHFVRFCVITFLTVLIPFSNCLAQSNPDSIKKAKSFFKVESKEGQSKKYSAIDVRRELDETEGLLKLNTLAPDWSYTLKNGESISSEKLKGKVYLLDFWGTWCPPCRKAMPEIEKIYQHYKDNNDVVIVGISAKEQNLDIAERYFRKKGYNYLHLPNGDLISDMFGIISFPTLFIINKDGVIVDGFMGFSEEGDFQRIKSVIDSNL